MDVAREEAVGADDDVNLAVGEGARDLGLLRGRAETAEHLDADGVGRHALPEGLEMLLRQDGGGDEDRHLAVVHDGAEGRADGHLGLAVADVAAEQAVHGLAVGHVLQARLHRVALVVGQVVGEGAVEGTLPVGRRLEALPLDGGPHGLQPDELRRQVPRGLLRVLACLAPRAAAQLRQRRQVLRAAHILADEVGLLQRDVEPVLVRELQLDGLDHLAVNLLARDAVVAADAVVDMDGVAADVPLLDVLLGVAFGDAVVHLSASAPDGLPSEEFLVADEDEVRRRKEQPCGQLYALQCNI